MGQTEANNHLPPCSESPWDHTDNQIWLGSTLSLHRNLEKLPFPGKLSVDKQKQILTLLSRILLACKELSNPKCLKAEELSAIDKEFFVEHFLSHYSLHLSSEGGAFVLDDTGEFLATINVRDHLIFGCIDVSEELEKAWDRLVKIELAISKSINFAFSPKFGFLTSDPAQCGTACVGTVFLHLPALIYTHHLDEIVKKNKDSNVEQTGLQGDPNAIVGDIVAFHNRYTLGVTEENILSALRTTATKLVAEEKSARGKFKNGEGSSVVEMKDKVSRAYGVLMHSYQIEAVEALHALSLVKMGLDLGWLKGATHSALNHLFFTCRRAHLLCLSGHLPHEELPHRRAEFIHSSLQGLELLI